MMRDQGECITGIKLLQRALSRRDADVLETPFEPLEPNYPAIAAWLERMKALPGWKHPYDLMPGYPFGTSGYRNQ